MNETLVVVFLLSREANMKNRSLCTTVFCSMEETLGALRTPKRGTYSGLEGQEGLYGRSGMDIGTAMKPRRKTAKAFGPSQWFSVSGDVPPTSPPPQDT